MSAPDRTMLLDPAHPILSIRRQCGLLGLARSGVYRPARIANDDELAIRRRLDELFLLWPVLRLAPDDSETPCRGLADQPQARPASDAADGPGRARPEAEDLEAGAGP